uniref:BHLH domain-containing protein n=1 Tax=Caenorhabditis tropicalis TaxID=1561998 RepID=A0A1I7TRZ8_9PELO
MPTFYFRMRYLQKRNKMSHLSDQSAERQKLEERLLKTTELLSVESPYLVLSTDSSSQFPLPPHHHCLFTEF